MLHSLFKSRLDSHGRKAGAIPTSAQCFHEVDGCHHALSKKLRRETFCGQRLFLRGDDVEISDDTSAVTGIG